MAEITHWVLGNCVQKIGRMVVRDIACSHETAYISCQSCMDEIKRLRTRALQLPHGVVEDEFSRDRAVRLAAENLELRKRVKQRELVMPAIGLFQEALRKTGVGSVAWFRYTEPRDMHGTVRLDVRRENNVVMILWSRPSGYKVHLVRADGAIFEGGERATYNIDEAVKWTASLLEVGRFPLSMSEKF